MAKPIGATPVLTGKEAEKFLRDVHRDSKKLVSLTPTPKLAQARKLIKKHGANR